MKSSEDSVINLNKQYEVKPKSMKIRCGNKSKNDQKLFWGLIKKVSKGSLVETNIPAQSWYDYYSTLLNRRLNNVNLSFDRFVQSYLSTHDRSCSICSGEDSSDHHELLELNKDFTDTGSGKRQTRHLMDKCMEWTAS